ncbi:glycosyltransferase family 87 protein [Flavobacterium sp.]|uniref:glycosyltransferase family 87 protein n=1 Tax=Flavobacterium sp. TaxID=239 RepID=UPI0039E69463
MKALLEKYYLLPTALLCLFYLYQAIDFPVHDFANYYFGGKFLAQGHFSHWVYFPYEFNKSIAHEGYQNIFVSYAPNTPFLALCFLPLSFLGLATAKLVFNGISIWLFLFTLKRLADFYRVKPIYMWLVPVLFFVPIKNDLLFGQVYLLLFFLLGESWIAYKRNEKFKTAVLLSFAILFKIFPVALLLLFLFRKKFQLLAYTGICGMALFAMSVLFGGLDIWIFFAEKVLPKAANGEISEGFVPNYQSVLMFLKQMLVFDPIENPHPVFNLPLWFAALVVAFKIKLIAIGYYVSRKVKLPLLAFSYWILVLILTSPYGSTYTFILLLFPFIALVCNPIRTWKKVLGLLLIFCINNIPVSWFMAYAFPMNYLRLFAVLLLLTLVFSLVYQKIKIWKVGAVALVPMLLVLLFSQKTPPDSAVVFGKNEPMLVYDFSVANQKLTYHYWNESGANKATFDLSAHHIQKLPMHGNEIMVNGSAVTHDQSNKLKPLLINNRTIVYLSDFDRGIGFYTLRKKTIDPSHE